MDWVELFFTPRGRVGRGTFWTIAAVWLLLDILLTAGISIAARWSGDEALVAVFFWASVLYSLTTFFPMIAVAIKRLHDTGRSGHWMLLPIGATVCPLLLIAAVSRQALGATLLLLLLWVVLGLGSLVLLLFWAQAGDSGHNEFGAP